MQSAVHLAQASDIPSWLEIATEVEALFGPMPMFDVTLRNNVACGSALCARNEQGLVTGGLLLGGTAPDNWIRWLAVRRASRRQGVGAMLVQAAVSRCAAPCTISLATFGADNADGLAARALYERLGFAAGEILPRGPEGGTRQLFEMVKT